MTSKSIKALLAILIVVLSINLLSSCRPAPKERVKKEKKPSVKKKKTEEIQHDLAIEKVTFNPAPAQTNKMDSYTDYFFNPTDEMEVTINIVNRGDVAEYNSSVKAALYQTESGELPPETEESKVSEQQQIIKNIAPQESAVLNFKFTGLQKFTQSHHLGYVIRVEQAKDKTPEDNKYRAYFWLLYGE